MIGLGFVIMCFKTMLLWGDGGGGGGGGAVATLCVMYM